MGLEAEKRPEVAIIMRSKDEQPYVESSIKNLLQQTYKNFVLYNIDSGSTDGSYEAVLKYNPDSNKVFQIQPHEYVPGKVLNDMISKTRESIVVFLNSDAIPVNEFWLEKLLHPILNGDADAVMSKQIARPDAYFIVDYDYQRAYDPKNIGGNKNAYFFSAVACAFRRELWENVKFYTDGYSEDVLWCKECMQKGYKFTYAEDSVVEHSHNYTLKQLYRRKYIEAAADVIIYDQHPSILKQSVAWTKELARDLWFTSKNMQWQTIPYNIAYRTVAHCGFYMGKRAGMKQSEDT